ncbi:MAG: SsrA-binding protein SmpB [Fimbriimonadaceae bacterium]|jgi:SsrA-binding protein|nr:SsrA-binding protein SmpB [Fimbriimonadaceae bacterium]
MSSKGQKKSESKGPATISNRKAGFDYIFEEHFEAGIVLVGSEVKSLFLGRANLTDGYCRVVSDELWLFQLDIEPYAYASHYAPERRRDRKLLMKRKEIDLIRRKTEEKGLALIPTRIYFKGGKAKVNIALARGKKNYDKRESIKEKDQRRDQERDL